jgi:hypothetical protein
MTDADKAKLIELVADLQIKSDELSVVSERHSKYMASDEYKYGSTESVNLAFIETNANLDYFRSAEALAKFVSEKIDEIF